MRERDRERAIHYQLRALGWAAVAVLSTVLMYGHVL